MKKCNASTSHSGCAVFFAKQVLTFCFAKSTKNTFGALQKYIWCKNVFDAKMLCFLLCKKQRCCSYILLVLNIFLWKMYAEHFPLENVQHHILLCKMFSITFSKGKCSATHSWTFSKGKMFSIFVFCKAKNTAFFRFRGALTFCWCWTFSKRKCSAPAKC